MPWSWWCSKGMVAVAACQVATTVREEGDLKGTERGHKEGESEREAREGKSRALSNLSARKPGAAADTASRFGLHPGPASAPNPRPEEKSPGARPIREACGRPPGRKPARQAAR